jgi:hypothetical protein
VLKYLHKHKHHKLKALLTLTIASPGLATKTESERITLRS